MKALTAAGAALAVLALPSAAAAHSSPDYRDVRSHVRSADRALDTVTGLVGAGQAAQATGALAQHRRQVRAALKDARGALRGADNSRELRRAALAYRTVARAQGLDSQQYTQLLGADLTGSLQSRLARLLNVSLSEREDALNQLTALLDELPAGSQVGVSRWIRHLTNDGDAQVGSLIGLLAQSPTAFPPDVQAQLAQALERATGAVEEAMARLDGIVALLPAQAREPVRMAVDQIETTLALIRGTLESFVGTLPAAAPGEVPALPDFATLLPGLQRVLPGLGGTLPGSGELLGNLTNILPALEGLTPGLGEGLPGGTGGGTGGGATDPVTGLIDNLLGGLLGGLL